MKILYFDCFSGISGDMTLGALLDLGVDHDRFLEELGKLNIDEYDIKINKGIKNGISGTDVVISLHSNKSQDGNKHEGRHDHEHSHGSGHSHQHPGEHVHSHNSHSHHHHGNGRQRNFLEIKKLIQDSGISEKAKEMAIVMFEKLARAEGKIHGISHEEVHFHEVGAVDSIVDIVGTAICIDIISPDKIMASPVHVGGGMIKCQHGIFPVPAPATLELLKGIPVYSKGFQYELVTPTGATILASLCSEFTDLPGMIIQGIGYGMGKREYEIPNCLRVYVGESIKK